MSITAVAVPESAPPSVVVSVAAPMGSVMQSVRVWRNDSTGRVPLRTQPSPGFDSRQMTDFEAPYGQSVTYEWQSDYLTAPSELWSESWADLDDWSVTGAGWSVSAGALVWSGPGDADASVSRAITPGVYRIVLDAAPTGIARVQFSDTLWVDVPRARLVVDGVETAFDPGSGAWQVDVSDTSVAVTTTAGTVSVAATMIANRVAFVGAIGHPMYVSQWRSPIDPQFVANSAGIWAHSDGTVYAAVWVEDPSAGSRVFHFAADGTFVRQIGDSGGPEGYHPAADVCTDSSGNIYVADFGGDRVQKYSADGTYLGAIGESGSGDGQFTSPCGVAVDTSGNLYVADQDGRVQKFDAAGDFILKWSHPMVTGNIRIDGDGNIWVSNALTNEVWKHDPTGTLLDTWDSTSHPEINSPRSVTFDAAGNVYLVNQNGHQILKYTPDGTLITTIGAAGTGAGRFDRPRSATINGENLYVLDAGNGRIQRFTIPDISVLPVTVSTYGELESVTETSMPVILTPDKAWLVHPGKPALSVPMLEADHDRAGLKELTPVEAPSTTTLHRVLGSEFAVATNSGPRLSDRLNMVITLATADELTAMRALLRDQTPLLIRFPPAWQVEFDDGFYAVGDLQVGRLVQMAGISLRNVLLPLTAVESPIVTVEEFGWSYAQVASEFESYTAVLGTFATYADLAANIRS